MVYNYTIIRVGFNPTSPEAYEEAYIYEQTQKHSYRHWIYTYWYNPNNRPWFP